MALVPVHLDSNSRTIRKGIEKLPTWILFVFGLSHFYYGFYRVDAVGRVKIHLGGVDHLTYYVCVEKLSLILALGKT